MYLIFLNCILAKTIGYFFFPYVFFFVITHNVCHVLFNEAIGNWPTYLFTLIVCLSYNLEYQTSRFYHTSEANLVPMSTFVSQMHFASFTFIDTL